MCVKSYLESHRSRWDQAATDRPVTARRPLQLLAPQIEGVGTSGGFHDHADHPTGAKLDDGGAAAGIAQDGVEAVEVEQQIALVDQFALALTDPLHQHDGG